MEDIFGSKGSQENRRSGRQRARRIVKRRCEAIPVKEVLLERVENWKGLQTVVRIR